MKLKELKARLMAETEAVDARMIIHMATGLDDVAQIVHAVFFDEFKYFFLHCAASRKYFQKKYKVFARFCQALPADKNTLSAPIKLCAPVFCAIIMLCNFLLILGDPRNC